MVTGRTGRIISPSQFILTYGVGSIIETDYGSRIIPAFSWWGKYFLSKHDMMPIDDSSAINQLKNYHKNPRIFNIPTNADIGKSGDLRKMSEGQAIYLLKVFPRWGVCMMHSGTPILAKMTEYGKFNCPTCKMEEIQRMDRITGIRFVIACHKGHLDDVDWPNLVHQYGKAYCDCERFGWTGEGQTTHDIKIECIQCHSQIRLSQIYRLSRENKLSCSGRFTEKDEKPIKCNAGARLLLRSGSNLRIPEVQVSLTVPYRDSPLYAILSTDTIYAIISVEEEWTVNGLCSKLRKAMRNNPKINEIQIKEIEKYSDNELNQTLRQLIDDKKNQSATSDEDVKRVEFEALVNASRIGHPPEHNGRPTKFEVERSKIVYISHNETDWKVPFIVTPVKTLSVVQVQLGYRREVGDTEGEIVQTMYEDPRGDAWFPGIQTMGEGIFLRIANKNDINIISLSKRADWNLWQNEYVRRRRDYRFHPLFVWWHSISHRITSALSIDSGYSAASIRERIYIRDDRLSGGILLYTAQTGGDGTLGGLVGQVLNFQSVLNRAANSVESCSNDPLCSDYKMANGRENGAACYTCMLLSETSCEHRNRMLDRNLLANTVT